MKKKTTYKSINMKNLRLKTAKKSELQKTSGRIIQYVSKISLMILLMMTIAGCSLVPQKVTVTEGQRFDAFLEQMARDALKSSPLTATFTLGDLEKEGLKELSSQLDHLSLASIEESRQRNEMNIKTLQSFDKENLSDTQQINYELVKFNLTHEAELGKYEYIQSLIQASSGIQVDFPLALMQIEFETKDEIDSFLLRVQEFPRLVDEVIAYEQERYAKGYALPGYIYEQVVQQIDGMLVEPENFLMVLSFYDRIDQFDGLTSSEKEQYKSNYLTIIKEQIYPALQKIREQAVSMESSKASGSISDWPDGKAYYEDLIAYMTSDALDVKGLEEWATNEINSITTDFQTLINGDPQVLDIDFEAAFPKYQSIEEIYAAVNKVYKKDFMDYGITLATENIIPEYLEDTLPAGFYFPITVDGEDYGNMYLQQKDYDQPTADTLMLFYHENIPGHHLYYSYISKSEEPLYRKMNDFLAYEEGWATYCQNLSLGNMELDKSVAKFFELNNAYTNAFMVLMDIQLHYYGKSVDEIKQQFLSLGYDEASVDSMVDRMISKPGETIHYMYGSDKISEWRVAFEKAKGPFFDLNEFHDFVLSHYGLPFNVVEAEMDELLK